MIKFIVLFLLLLTTCSTQDNEKLAQSILREQLENNHTNKDWYVPLSIAIEGLTQEQANWKDSSQDHSVCAIVSHIIFWNERILLAYSGKQVQDFNDDNEETFTRYCYESWDKTIEELNKVQTAWEQEIQISSNEQLNNCGSEIASMTSHMAYHTGQIVYIRKQHGWWDNEMGVK